MFAKPQCYNVLQPEPRSGECCNTLSHEGLANVNTEKNVISSLLSPFKHKQFQIILFNCMQKRQPKHHEAYNKITPDKGQSKTSISSTNVDQK